METVATRPGLVGAHLLQHDTPRIETTTEQKIRGSSDKAADWILLVSGYDEASLLGLCDLELSEESLVALGAAAGRTTGLYSLSQSATPFDIA